MGVGILLLIAGYVFTAQLVRLAFKWAGKLSLSDTHRAHLDKVRRVLRNLLRITLGVFCLGLAVHNGYLIYQGQDILNCYQDWADRIPPRFLG
jgi:hypothetical protein